MTRTYDDYRVERIPGGVGKAFIRRYHYSRSCHNGPMTWGLYRGNKLVGVCAFATPCSEKVRASIFGSDGKDRVTELHRLVVTERNRPNNLTSWFTSRAMKGLVDERPNYDIVISFADETEGHLGIIYQALNAIYCGMTGRAKFFRDGEGRLRHPRQNGVNISADEAKGRGWTAEMREAKHRYLLVLPHPPAKRRAIKRQILLDEMEYPRASV